MCCLAPWVIDPRKHTFKGGKAGSCCWIAFQCDVPHFTVKANIRDSPQKPTANIWHFRFECFCYSGGFLKCSFSWGFVRTIGLFYFFKDFFFFWCGPFLKSLLNLLQYCFCFMFWFFGCQACGILALQSGIEPPTPCIGTRSLNHWTTEKEVTGLFKNIYSIIICNDIIHEWVYM